MSCFVAVRVEAEPSYNGLRVTGQPRTETSRNVLRGIASDDVAKLDAAGIEAVAREALMRV